MNRRTLMTSAAGVLAAGHLHGRSQPEPDDLTTLWDVDPSPTSRTPTGA